MILSCPHGCGYKYSTGMTEALPERCARCHGSWGALLADGTIAVCAPVPDGPIGPHPYVLTQDDWLFLWGCKIDPEIDFDEAR